MSWYPQWRPYVPVAKRRARAAMYAAKLAKKEKRSLACIELTGRAIATSFWGKAWCDNLERYSDFANRLPRGRSYVRNGSVIDLQVQRGKVKAIVSGSEIYHVTITIKTLPAAAWSRIKKDCTRCIDSLIDLLQARFDQGIMERLTQRNGGLFPQPQEIDMECTCPDWAGMCKHVAATLYGVGVRLDTAPELLFTLRDVDHHELISQAVDAQHLDRALQGQADTALAGSDLGEIFGIDLDTNNGAKADRRRAKDTRNGSPVSSAPPRTARKPTSVRGKAKKPEAMDPAQSMTASAARRADKPVPVKPRGKARARA